jgi:RNA polymerase sigma-70 factor (ECF subfamily)
MDLEDRLFLELYMKNKDEAFLYLIEKYAAQIFNTCMNIVRHFEDAEDVTQEVFTTVYISLENFNGTSKLSTWIYGIALNKSKEFLRKKTRQKRSGYMIQWDNDISHSLTKATIEFNHPGVLLENKERTKLLFNAIDQLSMNQKIAYTLHNIDGISYNEVAEIMGLSIASVESLIFRAKRKLKQLLADYYDNK